MDETFREYIQPSWSGLQVLASLEQFRTIAYKWRRRMPPRARRSFSKDWMRKNILHGHGSLASAYPTRRFVSEGDSPAFMHQIRTGLGSLAHPSYGGWGGRFERESEEGNVWRDARDDGDLGKPIWRWSRHFQNDWAARADWSVKAYEEANHPPRAVVNEIRGRSILRIEAEAESTVTLSAAGSSDPDGDELFYEWRQYMDAGTCREALEIRESRRKTARVEIPEDAEGCELHVILTVRDGGSPNLVAYRRVILDVARKSLLRRLW